MARFLSREWFDELDRASGEAEELRSSLADRARPDVAVEQQPGLEASLGVEPLCVGEGQDVGEAQDVGETLHVGEPDLVVDVVVSGTPEGEVRYQLVVDGDRARILSHEPGFWPAQVELASDYATMAGLASGRISALEALSRGQARLSGDMAALSSKQSTVGGLDLLPPPVRATTTF